MADAVHTHVQLVVSVGTMEEDSFVASSEEVTTVIALNKADGGSLNSGERPVVLSKLEKAYAEAAATALED